MKKVTLTQLKYQTPKVIALLEEGEPLLITKRGKPWGVMQPPSKVEANKSGTDAQ